MFNTGKMISIVVAFDLDLAIAKNGVIPWHFPEDMRHFRELTMGHVVIMGRKTWDSLPAKFKPLPGRTNIVITRQGIESHYETVYQAKSIEESVSLANQLSEGREIFVIGGAQIYQEFLDRGLIDRIVATEVVGSHDGDTFFCKPSGWWCTVLMRQDGFYIVEYKRL